MKFDADFHNFIQPLALPDKSISVQKPVNPAVQMLVIWTNIDRNVKTRDNIS